MAESDLSAEVNATTVLPAPSLLSATATDNGNVDLSWTNKDDSIDGGIDVDRSTDGFSTVNTVTSGLSPSATTYTDTSTSGGEIYEYRIERNTDHATATSETATVKTINQIGTAKIRSGSTIYNVPVYSLDSFTDNWLRVRLSDGTVGAMMPIDSTGSIFRTRRASNGNIYGIKTK